MSERPILFSAPMVLAILEGRKTQTRRIVTDHTSQGNRRVAELMLDDPRVFVDPGPSPVGNPGPYLHAPVNTTAMAARLGGKASDYCDSVIERLYPRVFVGDVLWVRERFLLSRAEPPTLDEYLTAPPTVRYYASDHPRYRDQDKWKPSIHMPRWACRLRLKITTVRVERLREISEEDAEAEGVDAVSMDDVPRSAVWNRRQDFSQLWDRINGKRATWQSNPWVWVIEFERIES